MTHFEFGDIVLVPFPFTDQSTRKKRPAVVVSTNSYNTARPDLVIMAVTSQIRQDSTFDLIVHDWQSAGLLKPSAIKPVITTIEKGLVIRTMGRLNEMERKALQKQLGAIIG